MSLFVIVLAIVSYKAGFLSHPAEKTKHPEKTANYAAVVFILVLMIFFGLNGMTE